MIEIEVFHRPLGERKIPGLILSDPRFSIHDCFPGVSGRRLLQPAQSKGRGKQRLNQSKVDCEFGSRMDPSLPSS